MSDPNNHAEQIKKRHEGVELVDVFVNGKKVIMPKVELTGEEIKVLAIAEGVQIKLDFVLFVNLANGKQEMVKDHQRVMIHAQQRFEAIDNDDNS